SSLDDDPLTNAFRRPAVQPAFRSDDHIVPGRRGADPFETTHMRPVATSNLDIDPFKERFGGAGPSSDRQALPQSDHAPATAQAISPPRVSASRKVDFDALIGDVPGAAPKAVDADPWAPRTASPEPVPYPE